MKKILLIITFSLLTSSNSFAERLNWFFSKWLSENGHHQYLNEQGSHNLNIKINNKINAMIRSSWYHPIKKKINYRYW